MKVFCKVCIWRAERRALARATTSMQRTNPLHAPLIRSAERARISNASLHALVSPRRSHSHVAHADCMVLESRAACVQMLQGLSCNRRADASAAQKLGRRARTAGGSRSCVLRHGERAALERSTPWCSMGRLRMLMAGLHGARVVLDAGHSVRLSAAAGRPQSRG